MNEKVAIVTGASSGIGLEIASGLLEAGYRVVAVSRSMSKTTQLTEGPRLVFVDGDVASVETAERAVSAARGRFQGLDLVVNNAGIFLAKPFVDYTPEDYERLVGTNLAGFFHMTQKALPELVRSGRGHVVGISTSLTVQPIQGVPSALPIAIKGGIEAATRSLAIEYSAERVRFNAVSPGIIDTPMHGRRAHDFLKSLSPSGRLGTTREIFDAVYFLDSLEYVNGEVLRVDGGAHAGKWS